MRHRARAESVEKLTAEISINAPAERVWDVLTDLEKLPGTDPSMLSAHWLDGATVLRQTYLFAAAGSGE